MFHFRLCRDGNLAAWIAWSGCSKTCTNRLGNDVAIKTRSRTYTNPSPAHGGDDCIGRPEDVDLCNYNTPCGECVFNVESKLTNSLLLWNMDINGYMDYKLYLNQFHKEEWKDAPDVGHHIIREIVQNTVSLVQVLIQ